MRRTCVALLAVAAGVGWGVDNVARATTPPEPDPAPAFLLWAAEQGLEISRVACNIETVTTCYGVDAAMVTHTATMNPDGTFTIVVPSGPAVGSATSTTVAPLVPAADVGTRDNPVPTGTPAEVGADWSFVVDSVDRDAWDVIRRENMFNEEPPDGYVYVIVRVTTTYNGPDRDSLGFSVDISAVTSSNVEADPGLVVIPDELDVYRDVFSGGSNSGNLLFLAPANELDSLVIYVSESFGSSDAVYFSTVPGLFPIGVGSDGPAVAAIQGLLGLTADCDFGDQTRAAVEQWQTSVGRPVDGSIDAEDWPLLQVPASWGTDANANGQVDPDELALVCDGNVEFPTA